MRKKDVRVFISYSSLDEEVASSFVTLFDSLELEYFLDKKEINWGEQVESAIARGIESCSHLVVIISAASVKSDWVPYEVGQARALKKTILPFLTHKALDLPPFLASLHYMSSFQDVQSFFRKLVPAKRSSKGSALRATVPSPKREYLEVEEPRMFLKRSAVPFRELFQAARTRMDLLVVHGGWINEKASKEILAALERTEKLKVRILFLDPESDFLKPRAKSSIHRLSLYIIKSASYFKHTVPCETIAALTQRKGKNSRSFVYG